MMNSASSLLLRRRRARSRPSPSGSRTAMCVRDVERVAQLVRHDDRADVLEIAQLDDLVVDRRRRDRIEAGRRLVVEQDLAAWTPSRARSPRGGAARPTAPTASCRCARRGRRSRAPPSTRRSTSVERHVGLLVQLVADVLAHGQRVEERAFLEDHAEVGAHRHHLALGQLVDALRRSPSTAPASACSSPRMIFRMVDLPEPLAPRMIFVWPCDAA